MSKKTFLHTNRTKQGGTSSLAAEIIASNVDLLTEILLRVPAKSLIKFKSVSKQWLPLISDSGFARNHTHQNPAPLPSGLYFYCDQSPEYSLNGQIARISLDAHPRTTLPDFSFLDGSGPGSDITVRRSSNGLILCSSRYYNTNVLTICNPTTQKFVVLPTLTAMSKSYIGCGSYLVFYPKKSPYYKVVVVSYSNNLNTSKFDVYSSESGSWKSTTLAPRIRHWGIIHGAVWDGAIIEMSCVENGDGCANHDHLYSRFNVDEEKLTSTRVSSPDTNLLGWILYFGECGGQLLLIQAPREATEFRVLEMIDEKNNFRWTVKYVVDLTPPPPLILLYRSVINVMNVEANENGHAIMLYIQGKVLQYDIKCNTLKVLWEFPGGDLLTRIPYCLCHYEPSYHFIESLAPV